MTLDEAWAEAEKACREGWAVDGVRRHYNNGGALDRYTARAVHPEGRGDTAPLIHAEGDTPADSLRALAARLREDVA